MRLLFLVALVPVALAGCGTGRMVQRGINCYHGANYYCALAELQQVEPDAAGLDPRAQVRYLAYRGLTHYRLGQVAPARHFLEQASSAYRAGYPGWLPPDVVNDMDQALAQLSGQPAGGPPTAPPAPRPPPPPPGDPETIQ